EIASRRTRLAEWAPLAGHLLLRAFERAQRIHRAMLARGFDGELRSLRELRWTGRDTAFVLGWGAFFVLARAVDLPLLLGRLAVGR
ncbi:MAG: energy-coupling factor transporter transmembrane component T, partial [bacterium]